jgi:S-adenosylmethionine:tRNA ribosyltransferase-isomerase
VWRGGLISESRFADIGSVLPAGSLLVFNNTRVVRARIVMHKPSGARIEVLCLEPHSPADYERAFAVQGSCEWSCMVGNLKKWKEGALEVVFQHNGTDYRLLAWRGKRLGQEQIVRFEWDGPLTFGQLLELLGRVPIPPYLGRDSQEIDNTRYQTVYAKFEGSVAAPTAGLHFTTELIEKLKKEGTEFDEVTLHVGAGTFLPVKEADALAHPMHAEHFEVTLATIHHLIARFGHIIAVGTTSVRTLESLVGLAWRIAQAGEPQTEKPIGQFELYDISASFGGKEALQTLADYMTLHGINSIKAVTQIMITPAGFRYRIVSGMVTNFHQPKSTLLLLVSAFVGGDWRAIYDYALSHNFRFLSYGDSSIILK